MSLPTPTMFQDMMYMYMFEITASKTAVIHIGQHEGGVAWIETCGFIFADSKASIKAKKLIILKTLYIHGVQATFNSGNTSDFTRT